MPALEVLAMISCHVGVGTLIIYIVRAAHKSYKR
ncbi:hypothetical protein [Escherichia phage Lidtsur]|uniref:Uncharacterized protein n=1 Tax=Escherichia phage Lidtsur TaxID=2562235 RepID=A0A4D6DYX9_9CAUD|nr:hypothetical protein HOV34_gp08 [Escherichia phage Lidtsur]QBZ71512.1 hypothetical protein [Escherichia phage Lidtsur]